MFDGTVENLKFRFGWEKQIIVPKNSWDEISNILWLEKEHPSKDRTQYIYNTATLLLSGLGLERYLSIQTTPWGYPIWIDKKKGFDASIQLLDPESYSIVVKRAKRS